MAKNFIVMDNDLIRASYKLTVNEIRLIFVALTKLPKDRSIELFEPFYITKDDFVCLGADPQNVARDIRAGSNDLLGKYVIIDTPIEPLKITWISSVLHFKSETFERLKKQYPDAKNDEQFINALRLHNLLDSLPIIAKSDDNIVARVVFNPLIIPFICELKKQFTKLNPVDFFNFSSFYSFRIYLMMMQFRETGFLKISIADLRKSLDLTDKYEANKDFKVRVIDTAVDEINEKSPYEVKYDLIKKGNKFHTLEIKFKDKKTKKEISKCPQTIDMFEEPQDTFIKMSDAQLDTFSSKLADLGEVQSMANVGEEMPAFKARLRSMLQDAEKQKTLTKYLKEVGFIVK